MLIQYMPFFNRPDCKKPLTTEEVYKEMVAQRLAQVRNSLLSKFIIMVHS